MVKRKKLKGGTSLEELQKFVTKVKEDIPYIESDNLEELRKKLLNLLNKQREYEIAVNKITPLTLTNYKESEYISYTPDTSYLIKLYMMQFIDKYIELTDSYNNIKNKLHKHGFKYLPRIQEGCLYLYIIDNKNTILISSELDEVFNKVDIINRDNPDYKYIELRKNVGIKKEDYIIIARLFIVPENFIKEDHHNTTLFMCIYEKCVNPYLLNINNESMIEELLKTYNTTEKKDALLQSYHSIDSKYNNAYLLLINYLYPKFHENLQSKVIKVLEKSILDLSITIQNSLDSKSKLVLIGGASFNIVTNTHEGTKNSINDFDFTVYSITKPDVQLFSNIVQICNELDISALLSPKNSLSRQSKKLISYNYDITKTVFKVRILKNKRISIDIIIYEKFIMNDREIINEFTLPIIDITIKDPINEDIFNAISKPCKLLLYNKLYINKQINILSHFGLLYNINITEITKRSYIKQSKDRKRWAQLLQMDKEKDIYEYNIQYYPLVESSSMTSVPVAPVAPSPVEAALNAVKKALRTSATATRVPATAIEKARAAALKALTPAKKLPK